MAKFCTNGHQMEDSWPDCPYCMRTGFQRSGLASGMDKTVIESGSPRGANAPAPPPPVDDLRKTVLLSTLRLAPVVGWLVALNGKHKGEDFRLREGQNIIGSKAGLDITLLNDSSISAEHASIRYRNGVFSLTDRDSTNGTFLNDREQPIDREELKDNDVIRIGEVTLKFKCL